MKIQFKDYTLEIDDTDASLLEKGNLRARIVNNQPSIFLEWKENGKKRGLSLAKVIRGASADRKMVVDFADGNPLNFARANLIIRRNKLIYTCPFSAERLHELHWKEGKSYAEIATFAQQAMEWKETPSINVIQRWFKELGVMAVPVKVRAQRQTETMRRRGLGLFNPDVKARALATSLKNRRGPVLGPGGKIIRRPTGFAVNKAAQVRARKASQKKAASKRITKPCATGCGKNITRAPYLARQSSENWFCSHHCNTIFHNIRRGEIAREMPANKLRAAALGVDALAKTEDWRQLALLLKEMQSLLQECKKETRNKRIEKVD